MPNGGGEAERATGRRPRLAVRLAAVAALCGGLLAAQASPGRAQVPDVEAQFVARIAAERQAAGLGALAVAADLVDVARRHSAVMASQNRLYHNPALGTQVANWLKVGENVGTGATVDNIHAALMASAVHRDKILGGSFTEVGVGVVATSDGALWVTQVFRQPEQAAAAPAPPPAPAPDPAPPAPPAQPVAAPPAPTTTAVRVTAPPAPTTTAVPATAPPATAPPAPPPVTAPAAPAEAAPPSTAPAPSVELAPVRVAASTALPVQAGVLGTGAFAAGLMWLVTAWVIRAVVASPRRRR